MSKNLSKPLATDIAATIPQELSDAERERIARFDERSASRPTTPAFRAETAEGKPGIAGPSHEDRPLYDVQIAEAFGTTDKSLARHLLRQAGLVVCNTEKNVELAASALTALVAAAQGIGPRDEVEALLTAQMVATHEAAMRLLASTFNEKPHWLENGNMAVKLMRTFTAQIEALKRYRSKGEQRVIVEHVDVHSGGQAIVGAVASSRGASPGLSKKIED